MASRHDDEGGSRLWRGMRHLIFGDDAEPTLRDQIEEAIEEAEESRPVAGDLTPPERQMLRNLLHFGDQTAGDICVTRGDIMAVPSTISFDGLIHAFVDAGHSRLPVFGDSLDEVVGMIHVKDVFMASVDTARDRSISALMREPLFVPESMGVIELLARMRVQRTHLAIVVDEFGGTEGLVTIEDVVEEIVGEIEDDTLGGLAFGLAGRSLEPGESVCHPSGWRLESVDADARRIKRVRLHAPEGEPQAD